MSVSDSDESINTEDLNELHDENDDVYEEVPVKGVERQTKKVQKAKPEKVEKEEEPAPKPKKELSEKQKANVKRLVEMNKKRAEERRKKAEEEENEPVKTTVKKRKPKEVVVNREIIKKIYYIPDGKGGYEQHLNKPRITKKHAEYYKNLEESEKEDELVGKVLLKTKKGKIDKRGKERTEAQKKATLALIEKNKERRLAQKKAKEETHQKKVENIKNEVHNTIVDVVKTPADQIKKREVAQPQQVMTEDEYQQAQQKKIKDLFS